uniref:Uncharacterized protein n=1 Tax=Ditylenchus dipsaci TaxID=166011 RepID=A0A915DZG1_9BILA
MGCKHCIHSEQYMQQMDMAGVAADRTRRINTNSAIIVKMSSPRPTWPTSIFTTMNGGIQPMQSPNSPSTPQENKCLGFRYVWPVKVTTRQLSPNEAVILQISQIATVHDHVSFQWTLKMHGTADVDDDETCEDQSLDEETEKPSETKDADYVAISLYYVDGPVTTAELKAKVKIVGEKKNGTLCDPEELNGVEERKTLIATRGRECEIAFTDRAHLSKYIKEHLGSVIRLSLLLEMDSSLFRTDAYLNAVSPTPIHSFLTANYRARCSSKNLDTTPSCESPSMLSMESDSELDTSNGTLSELSSDSTSEESGSISVVSTLITILSPKSFAWSISEQHQVAFFGLLFSLLGTFLLAIFIEGLAHALGTVINGAYFGVISFGGI